MTRPQPWSRGSVDSVTVPCPGTPPRPPWNPRPPRRPRSRVCMLTFSHAHLSTQLAPTHERHGPCLARHLHTGLSALTLGIRCSPASYRTNATTLSLPHDTTALRLVASKRGFTCQSFEHVQMAGKLLEPLSGRESDLAVGHGNAKR